MDDSNETMAASVLLAVISAGRAAHLLMLLETLAKSVGNDAVAAINAALSNTDTHGSVIERTAQRDDRGSFNKDGEWEDE